MAIRFEHQAGAGMVGAYAAGLGQGNERRRREQLALLERQRERLFQFGIQQQHLGARVQLQQAGFAHDRAQQQALFGQQQQLHDMAFQRRQGIANAEARARGEPLPFPGLGQGPQQIEGPMEGRILPGGRQAFEGPGTTVAPTPGKFQDDFLRIGGSPPLPGAPSGQNGDGPKTPHQQRLAEIAEADAATARRQADRDDRDALAKAEDDYRNGRSVLSTPDQQKMDALEAQESDVDSDEKMPEEKRREKQAALRAKRARLLSRLKPKPSQASDTWEGAFKWPGGVPGQGIGLQKDPKTGEWKPHDFSTKADMATGTELATARKELFIAERKRNAKRKQLQAKTKPDGTPLHTPEEVNYLTSEDAATVQAAREWMDHLSTPPESEQPAQPPAQAPAAPGDFSGQGEGGGASFEGATPVPVTNQADIQNVPNGTNWVAPDGQTGSVQKTQDPRVQRVIDAARAGDATAQAALKEWGVTWQQ